MVTNCSTLDGARQALLGVTVFPAILKTLSDLELLELQRQSVPCGREEEIGFRASSTKAAGRLHCLHLATVPSIALGGTPFLVLNEYFFELNPRKNPVLNNFFELNPRKNPVLNNIFELNLFRNTKMNNFLN